MCKDSDITSNIVNAKCFFQRAHCHAFTQKENFLFSAESKDVGVLAVHRFDVRSYRVFLRFI